MKLTHSIRIRLARFIRFALTSLKCTSPSSLGAAEVNSMLPLDNSTLPKKPTFFATTPPNSAALLYYDAVISVGLAACAKESWEVSERSERALKKTRDSSDEIPRNGYRHNGYIHY